MQAKPVACLLTTEGDSPPSPGEGRGDGDSRPDQTPTVPLVHGLSTAAA